MDLGPVPPEEAASTLYQGLAHPRPSANSCASLLAPGIQMNTAGAFHKRRGELASQKTSILWEEPPPAVFSATSLTVLFALPSQTEQKYYVVGTMGALATHWPDSSGNNIRL